MPPLCATFASARLHQRSAWHDRPGAELRVARFGQAYSDALGEKEWDRLTSTVRGRVSLEVHRRFLRRFVRPGGRVLEVGAGPGRFTFELAAIGARIVVTDVSDVQLGLNEARVGATDAERSVERRELVDVCDTSRYADAEFDAVVAFGGPLSYAFERTDEAMRGLLRVITSGGVVVASVMSLLGILWEALPWPRARPSKQERRPTPRGAARARLRQLRALGDQRPPAALASASDPLSSPLPYRSSSHKGGASPHRSVERRER